MKMETRKVKAIIEKGGDGRFSIYSSDDTLPYLVTGTGATIEEAKSVFSGGYDDLRRVFAEDGREFPEAEFEFVYDVPSFLQEFANVFTLAGLSRLTGVNQKRLGHYISGYRHPSAATVRKIEEGVMGFCDRLSKVKFA